MRRKFLLKVMILSLLFVAMGGGYLYSQDDVTIVTTETDLATALAAGGNVKLGNDIAVTNTIEIPPKKKVTLDLNGKSITADGKIYPINNDGELTINDSGEGGAIEGLGLSTGKTNSNNRSAGSRLTIKGGIFRNVYPDEGAALYVHMGIVEISGGKFYGQNVAISNTGGFINASNCFIDGYNYAVNATASTVISDAEISGKCIINDYIETTDVTFYQARIGEATDYTSYRTLEDAIQAAKSGDEIYVFAGTWDEVPAMKAGITINGEVDGDRKVVLNGTLSGTLENLTLKNLHIKGGNAQRWSYAKGDLYFENVTFEATSVYAIHFDGITEGANLHYKNCTIIGWAAMSGSPVSCKFENCTIKDNGTYGVIRTYFDATIKNCTFDIRNANPDDGYQDGIHAVSGADVVVTGCTNVNGDMKDIVNVSGNSTVEVDGVLIQNPVKVGDNYYATIQDAIVAAAPNGTVELLADVTVDKWIMFSERLSIGNGNIITKEINGLTIDGNNHNGNNHKLTINSIESAGNGNRLFYDATNLNIKDLTIECVDAAANQGGIGLTSGTISNVNFIGGGPAILPGTGEITVTGCTFKTNGTSIYYEEARDNLVVNGNTFENPDGVNVILLRGNTEFTNNIINSGRTVNVVSGSPVVSGNDFKDVRFKVYNAAEATISNNTINNLEFNDESVVYSTFTANTLSDAAQAVLDAMIVAKIGEVKYCSLQKAIDAAVDGNTITLIKDVTEDVTITQKADVNFTIDGAQQTMTGAITVDGQSGQIETAGLTIQNVKFDASNITTEASINLGVSGNTGSRYVSNLTVEGCTFIGKDQAKVAVKSYTGGDKNLTVTNCTVDATMHSLLQVNNVEGKLTLTGCTVKSKNGINLNSCTNVEMTGCNFEVQGYALRSGVSSGGNLGVAKTYVLENNTLMSACDDGDAVIMFRASSVDANFSMTKNVVKGTTHISGNTAATNIAADANYWGEGLTGPVVAEGSAPVVVNSYYTDEALTNLMRNPMGNDFTAYTSEDAIWGEVWGNATESFVIKVLDANGNEMGTTSLNNIGGIIDGDVNVTWSLKLDAASNTDNYWTMNWTTAPSINNMPAKVELYVDGTRVGGGDVVLNAPDNLSKIKAANIDANGKILAYRQELVDAVNNGDNIAILVAGTYDVPTGKDLTITGAVNDVQFGPIGTPNMGMKNYTFNNVTFNYAANSQYKGLQHSGNLVYNNCTFNGQVFLYGTSETFNNCTFNQEDSNNYNVWTYGAKEVAFNECTFNSAGKSVLVYNEGACATDLTVTDTKFIATATVDDKAAIEIDCSLMPKGTSIVIEGVKEGKTTATGFGTNTKSGSSLWNDKKVVEGAPNGGTSSEVIIDDVVVKEPALMNLAGGGTEENPYLISNLEDLIWFRYQVNAGVNNYAGKHVKLDANIDLSSIENWTPIGDITYNNKYQPADNTKVFSGKFNGNDKVISNLKIEKIIDDDTDGPDADANVGLFGITGEGAVIKDLTLTNVNIETDGRNVGALAGFAYKATLSNITVNGNIQIKGGNNVSGVAGMTRHYDMSATNIKVIGNDGSTIVGNNIVGGIFAEIAPNGSAQTFESLSVENVAITGASGVGGIVGLLTTGAVNNVSVKNVVLTGRTDYQGDAMGRIRLGSVSGLMGGKYATIANVTTENVTAKNLDGDAVVLPIIGANYDASSNATEAKIGDTYYATLQTAIDAAQDGTTINILADITGDVTILQQEGKNIVIDGKKNDTEKYTFNGTINIYGDARISGEETLTIQNINFYTEDNARYFIHAYDNGQIEGTNNHKQYAHNVTVENCKFATSAGNKPNTIVGMRFRQANDMSAVKCTSDGIFSIMWTTAVDGLTLNGVEATNCTEGITIGGASKKVNIIGTTIESDTYAIRAEGAGSDFIIENSTLVAKVPVVVRDVTENSMISFTFNGTNTITESNPTNYWFVAGEKEYNGTSEEMPEAPKGQVSVTLNDTGLRYEDVYGNYYELAGEGTANNPYTIANLYELKFFRDAVNAGNTYQGKYVELTGDINLAEGQTRSTESNWEPISTFNGTFDGADHTISNLVINGGTNSNQGFFGQTNNGEIKNVIFENAKVSGRLYVGVVAGTPYTSKYTNIKVTGHVEVNGMSYVGGVGGKNAYANWTDITVDVDGSSYVKATSTENGTQYRTYVGGVIGFNGEGGHTFKNITSNINVIGDVCDIGGIFGIAHYGNKFENITHTGTVTNTNSNAEDVVETGLIAGVWHNQAGTSVTFTNTTSDGTISVPNVTGVTFPNDGLIGAAYTTSNETSSTSGSLTINGEQVYPYVAKIGEVGYNTLAKAITAAQNEDVVTLLWVEGDAPIAMNASLYGKNVTITGTATVDWSKGFLFVGRGGEGNATLTFDGANLTSASDNASTGIHVSGREKNTNDKYDGTVVIKNSNIDLDYLIDKGIMTLDNSTLIVKNGFSVGGRPASETESGADATATMTLNNGSKVVVNNHNGMGLGYEAIGIMNINSGSTFETTQSFLITAKGTMNVNGGNVKTVGTLTNNGTINVTGESTLNIEKLEGSSIDLNEGAIVKNSTVGGDAYIAGNVKFRGDNTFNMITDYGDYYSQETPSMWTVEEGASLTLTNNDRYGLGYGDKVTVIGNIENALEARATLTDEDASVNMYGGLVGMTNSAAPNAENSFTATNAYLIFGVNGDKSFGNKPGEYYGKYTFTFNNSVVTANGFKFYEDKGASTVKFSNSDLLVNGVLMTNDASSSFTFENSVVLSEAQNNGTDDKNQNAGVMTLTNTQFTYSAAFTNVGTLNLDLSSKLTAPSVTGNGIINIDATNFDGNDICVISADMASFEGVINVEGAHYIKKNDGIYVTGAQGTLTKAYTSATGYWGECGGNANESFVLRFYNDDTYMGQTSLNDIDNIFDGDVYVTWSIDLNIDPNAEGYWAMSWDIRPTLAMQPNRVEQWIDGVKVAECAVEPNWADNIFPVVAAVTGEDDVILSYVNNTAGATLKDAFAAGGNIAILRDFNLTESVTVPLGKTVVLNLNGKTMSQTKACEASYEMINNKGNLTITGEGKISFKDTGAGDPNFGWGSYTVRNEGTLVVENGTIEHLGEQNQPSNVVHMYCAIFQYSGSSTINDGTISTPTYRSACLWKGDMTINGGTFDGQLWVQSVDNTAKLTINGGNFSPNGNDASSVFVGNTNYDAAFTVTGGTFETKIGCNGADNLTGDRIIGGLFTQSAVDNTSTDLLGEGFVFNGTPNANGYYTVIQVAGTQTRELVAGWSWFSTYIKQGNDGLSLLQDSLNPNGVEIKSREGFTRYYAGLNDWSPSQTLTSVSTTKMYMIKTSAAHTLELEGNFEDENIEITIAPGWNWIGYPVHEEISFKDALANWTPENGDSFKSKDKTVVYMWGNWQGDFNMVPGEGYMYSSKANDPKTLSYSTEVTGTSKSNSTKENDHWIADIAKYPSNMTVIAMLSIDNEIVDGDYEIAAFANGECRGSARPIYVEAIDAYVLLLTIQGEEVENLTFKYYDVNYGTEYELSNTMVYSNDAIVGTMEEPYMFNLGILNIDESSVENISIYPNPTTTGKEINLQAVCDKVEVFNALGVKVAEYTNVDSIDAIETAGIYVIRVTIDGNARNCRLIVK